MSKFLIEFTPEYLKKEIAFLRAHPDLEERYFKTLNVLENDPFYPSLRTHKLKGKLKDLYSISINMQYRILITFAIKDNALIPIDVGSHSIYTN